MIRRANNFDFLRVPVDIQRQSYDAETLLETVVESLGKRRLLDREEDVLLCGVRGTRRLIIERTHGDRFWTFAVPLGQLLRQKCLDQFEDPFWYAGDASDISPALMVYDSRALSDGYRKVGLDGFGRRFLIETGEHPGPYTYGREEGNLDAATRAVVLLKPVQ